MPDDDEVLDEEIEVEDELEPDDELIYDEEGETPPLTDDDIDAFWREHV